MVTVIAVGDHFPVALLLQEGHCTADTQAPQGRDLAWVGLDPFLQIRQGLAALIVCESVADRAEALRNPIRGQRLDHFC